MKTHSYTRILQWGECDPAGIIFFPNYLRWMADGVDQMFLAEGIDPNAAVAPGTRSGIPIVQLSMRFLGAPRLHETVIHQISVERLGGKSLTLHHRFLCGENLLAEADETRVWATFKSPEDSGLNPARIPDRIRAMLAPETGNPPDTTGDKEEE
ncbi:MAG: acyl-CoA thioesterase [Alcaligenaceae bacterium]|nr:acyl-CoA thioesterase [Alcaligenaceae bacterium SAGV5]MPS50699.1 acyl-CoA thioesterase [Alcaligenaceae bacterium SAGV3]MPT56138.1 acyl-CoA thioesterase [Alcaligenaceae bacterium]